MDVSGIVCLVEDLSLGVRTSCMCVCKFHQLINYELIFR